MYWFVDTIARLLDAQYIDGIIVSNAYTASYGRYGFKQKTILHIGVPLWAALNNQEKIALVAHELAHFVNGDFSNRFAVNSAFRSLRTWHELLSALFQPLAGLSHLGLFLTLRLMFHESRRAEYLADILAAKIGGTEATSSVLTKLEFHLDFAPFISSMKHAKISPDTLFDNFRNYIQQIVSDQKLLNELDQKANIHDEFYSLTHPPIAYRKRFLELHRVITPGFTLTADESIHLNAELANLEREAQLTLMRDA